MVEMMYNSSMDDKRKRAEYMRRWYAANPGYQKKYQEKYKADPERQIAARERAKAWYYENCERAKKRILAAYHAKPKKGRPKGSSHQKWKGGEVGYHALHAWIKRERGSPGRCEHCGTTTAKRFEWANKDHKYSRSLEDYLRLCTSCHRKYDYENGLSKKGGRRPLKK
jgi:hypothetical protein